MAGPEGGQDLRPVTLKPAEQPVSRLDASLDRQKLFLQRAAGGWRDFKASLPPRLATGFDGLVGGSRIAREILCARKEEKNTKIRKQAKVADGKKGRRGRRLTVNQIFDLAVARDQSLPGLSPASRLRLELGLESGFAVLRRLQCRLMAFFLVGQLLGQAVALLHQGGELGILGMKSSLGLPQLCPQSGIGRCRDGRKRKNSKRKSLRMIRPDCSTVGPNLGDYNQWVR